MIDQVIGSLANPVPVSRDLIASDGPHAYGLTMTMTDSRWWAALWDGEALAMAVLGPARTYVQINPAFCRLLAADSATITAWPYERIGHPLDLDVELDAFVRLAEGAATVVYHRRFRTAQGGEFSAEVRLCPGPDDQILQVVLPGMAPVTPGAEPLDHRLEQLGAALSHDALEPVRQISVQAGLLAHRCAATLAPRELDILAAIERSALKTGRQLRGLAAFARLGMPHIDPAPVPMRPVIDAAWQAQTVPPDTTFTVTIPEHVSWRYDPKQLTTAVGELLANAIRFREPSRPLAIHLTVTTTDDHCTIALRDNGLGIAAIDHPRLFRVFATIGSEAGVGLGLAMVQAVAENHGGQASVLSEPGQGTLVSFTLKP